MSTDEQQRWMEDMKRVQATVDALGEHFDTVKVFVSRHMPAELGGTIRMEGQSGNNYAIYGQTKEFVLKMEERIRMDARVIVMPMQPPPAAPGE